jgi:hypothetical protein
LPKLQGTFEVARSKVPTLQSLGDDRLSTKRHRGRGRFRGAGVFEIAGLDLALIGFEW